MKNFKWSLTLKKFKVGDRVKYIYPSKGRISAGSRGTVKYVSGSMLIGVEWDNYMGGHDGNESFVGKAGHCWIVGKGNIEILNIQMEFEF